MRPLPSLAYGISLAALALGPVAGYAPLHAQTYPPASTPLNSTDKVTCIQGNSPRTCTVQDIANKATLDTSANQNTVFAGPASGGAGTASFRILGTSDLPVSTTGNSIPLLSGVNTWSGKQTFQPSTTASSSISIPAGTAPTSPANGDMWTTSAGLFVRVNGVTQGPLTPGVAVDPMWFGCDPTGVAYCDAAVATALSISNYIKFSPGKVNLANPISYTFSPCATGPTDNKNTYGSLNIEGSGSDGTTLYWANGDGLKVTACSFQQSLHVSNITLATGSNGGGTAIDFENTFAYFGSYNSDSNIDNVTIRGNDGYGALNYWSTGVKLFNITGISFYNDNIVGSYLAATPGSGSSYGVGIDISSSVNPGGVGTCTEPGCSTSYNITNSNLTFLGVGINLGAQSQALFVGGGTAIINGCYGINVPSGVSEVRQVSVVGAQISVNCDAIRFNSAVPGSIISGNYIAVAPNYSGILLVSSDGAASSGATIINGNTFLASGADTLNGVYVNTNTGPVVIDANSFVNITTGIALDSASKFVTAGSSNNYYGTTSSILNGGTNNYVGAVCTGAPTSSFATSPAGLVTHC